MNEYIETGLTILLHLIGWGIVVSIIGFILIELIDHLRKLYDKTLWDTRERARMALAKELIIYSTWFNPDEMELIKTIGENIINNNGQLEVSSARDTYRKFQNES